MIRFTQRMPPQYHPSYEKGSVFSLPEEAIDFLVAIHPRRYQRIESPSGDVGLVDGNKVRWGEDVIARAKGVLRMIERAARELYRRFEEMVSEDTSWLQMLPSLGNSWRAGINLPDNPTLEDFNIYFRRLRYKFHDDFPTEDSYVKEILVQSITHPELVGKGPEGKGGGPWVRLA